MPRMSTLPLIATRESRLALWQAGHVRDLLGERCGLPAGLLAMSTQGDRILHKSLSKVGGKGLFVKELEAALADGRAQLAVHSLKDVPMDLPDGFELAAVLEREDPRDQLECRLALLLADHVAEDAAEQPDVVDQRLVLLGGIARRGSLGTGHGYLESCNLVTRCLIVSQARRGRSPTSGISVMQESCKYGGC